MNDFDYDKLEEAVDFVIGHDHASAAYRDGIYRVIVRNGNGCLIASARQGCCKLVHVQDHVNIYVGSKPHRDDYANSNRGVLCGPIENTL